MARRLISTQCKAKRLQVVALDAQGNAPDGRPGDLRAVQCTKTATGNIAGYDLCTQHVGMLHIYGVLDVVPAQEIRLTSGACGLHLNEAGVARNATG